VPTTTDFAILFVILEFRPLRKGSLLGFAKVQQPSGQIIVEATILTGPHGPWASPPSRVQIDKDGVALREPNGKLIYRPVIDFVDRATRSRWSDAVIAAMRASHSEAFADEPAI
jgi:hypothetical protein